MRSGDLAASICDVVARFELVLVSSEEELDEVFRIRHQVYCVERGFEPSVNGRESDEYDSESVHALVRHRTSGEALGTVRLVVPSLKARCPRLPMIDVCGIGVLDRAPLCGIAEISRFALSKRQRDLMGVSDSLLRLFLMRGIVALSGQLRLSHWCALMEPSLLRLLRCSAIHFQPAGTLVEHHGLRQPSVASIAEVLERMEHDQPLIWEFVTDGGTLWTDRQIPIMLDLRDRRLAGHASLSNSLALL